MLKKAVFLRVFTMAKKVVFSNENDKLVVEDTEDLHTKEGILKKEDLQKGGRAKTSKNVDLFVTDASFVDKLLKIKRGPAVMIAKDIGAIVSNTGVCSGWKVLDAGTGCGVLAAYLSRIVGKEGKVVSYEKRKEFLDIAKKNFEMLGVKVELKNKDVYSGIDEKELDLITLDLTEPWRVFGHAYTSLKKGGFIVCYVPTVSQLMEIEKYKDDTNFFIEKVAEVIERDWHLEGLKVRPKNRMLGHTGFLVFMRKI